MTIIPDHPVTKSAGQGQAYYEEETTGAGRKELLK
jgi:hypothetical protein